MGNLDIGLLGSVPVAQGEQGASVDPGPQVAPTGHTVLSHLTRRGDAAEVWYRGALAPREVKRRDAGSPFHARRLAGVYRVRFRLDDLPSLPTMSKTEMMALKPAFGETPRSVSLRGVMTP